jgi:hypothetical protein
LTFESSPVECGAVARRTIRVIDERGKAVPGAVVVWGTSEMLSDIPETMLPVVTSKDDGTVAANFPSTSPVYVRAAGAKAASWWQKVNAGKSAVAIRSSEATAPGVTVQLAGGGPVSRPVIEIEPVSVTSTPSDVRSWSASDRGLVKFLPMPKLAIRYIAWGADAAPQSGVATTAALPKTLSLSAGTRAEGLVHAPKLAAVPAAAIEAVFVLPGGGTRALRRRATSDAKGHFSVSGLPVGAVQLLITKRGYATAVRMLRLTSAGANEDFLLRPSRKVIVTVVERSGRAVPSPQLRTADGAHATGGTDGIALLDGIPADEDVSLQVRAPGFQKAQMLVRANAKDNVQAVLSRGVRFTATLVNAETHRPAGPGTLMIGNNGGRHVELFDASGVVDVGGLDAGTLSVEIRAEGSAPYVLAERTVADEERVDLGEVKLPMGASLTGHVLSRESGAPIINAHVKLLRRSGFGPIGAFVMRDWVEAASNEEGSFSVSGFDPGPQVLLVEAAGYASRIVTQEIRQDAVSPVDAGAIDLDSGRELIVECTPVPRCGTEARLLFAGTEFSWASIGTSLQNGTAHLLPAGSGTATLRLLSGSRIVDERTVEISPAFESTHVQVKLVAALVTGTVTSNGHPREAGQVQLERISSSNHEMPVYYTTQTAEGQQASSSWLSDSPDAQMAAVDPAGRFKFENVQPGTYTASYRLNGSSAAAVRVTIPDSERYDFSIELPPGELHGRVTDDRAVPIGEAIVEIRDANGEMHSAQSDDAGEFSASALPAGKAMIRASLRDREGNAEANVEPPRTAVADVVLRKKENTPVAVTVTDPAGQPLSGAVVFLLGSNAMPSAVATTNGSGIATLRLSQPLMTPIAVYHGAYGWSWLPARVLGSQDNSECTIRMVAGTGCVVVASKTAAAVDLYAPSGISLAGAFSFLGVPISVAPGSELRLSGLPPGAYTLRAGTFQAGADVHAGKDARVSIR